MSNSSSGFSGTSVWQRFVRLDYASGIVLFAAAIFALVAQNSGLQGTYDYLLSVLLEIRLGDFTVGKPLLLWVNDGLMAVFFFQVGLEIKKEVLEGELSDLSSISFPLLAACGGVVFPALIYWVLNRQEGGSTNGWAIPTATDIAFALGVLALLGKRVPAPLKIFLLTLAVLDDLAAVLIIAFFYTGSLSMLSLAVAAGAIVALFLLNRTGVTRLTPYVIVGLILWVSVLKSGIHATLAGVVLALFIPARARPGHDSLLHSVMEDLHDSVYWVILPVFAFANAGVNLTGMTLDSLIRPVPLGILLGLFFGKQIGIMLFAFLGVRSGLAQLPDGVNWRQLHAVSVLCGIGFSMSLFISSLAFDSTSMEMMVDDRIGIIVGSLLSGVCGYWLLRRATKAA